MPVEHQARALTAATQNADRLPTGNRGIEGMHDVHHGYVEANVLHPFGEMIGDRLLLEGGTGDAEQRLFHFEHARGIDVLLHAG